jgi:hypothetical protein
MKPLMKPIFLCVCLFLSAWGFAQTPVAINGQLKVVGTKLVNKNGYPVQLRGMSTHGIQWYGWGSCLTEASLDALAYDWGADVLRISMYVQEGGYETDPAGFTAQVNRLIEEATERGMYALVDWHQLTPGDPNYNLLRAKTFFSAIANQHKNKNNIIYDICNEPNSGTTWAKIKTYADQMIPFIRAIDNDAVICVGTHGWSTFGLSGDGSLQDVINNPLQFPNVMYTFHFYAKDHRTQYLNQLNTASDRLPIFVTEFGTQEASGDGPNDFAMAQQFIDLMRNKKISWTNWNYSDDFRSGAVWTTGTCSNGPWTTARLKPAGAWVRERMLMPADDFGGSGPVDTTGPTNPDPTNIALNKPVTVTSVEDNTLTGNFAVDGNGSTRWASAGGIDPQSITVDLGGQYNISRIKLAWEAAYGKNFVLEISPNNSNWTNVKNITNNTSLTNDYTGLTATGRYVRLTGTARGTEYGYSLYEFEVYGKETTTTTPPQTGSVLIQAESFSTMLGVQTEATTDVDGGQDVGWIDQGDWMAFNNINFPVSGTYKVEYRVASENGGGRVSCDLNAGAIQLGQLDVPSTGGWQNWTTISHNVTVNAGTYNFGVFAQASGWNLNWIRITPVTTTTKKATRMEAVATAANSLEQRIQVYPVPSKDQVTITLPESNQKTQIVVTDLTGKTYYTGTTSGNVHQLQISKYPAGIYVVQLINGNTRTIKRIIKK